ncbi:MAG: TetR family transcriptional regulator [Nocardia sp.]|uniref:TetR/AcrR family transcriptional regulator n=1 Tax=Nocardia sp. TaxID=1821 RepID=UPI0026389EA9|nr:helix-turn-helix domain-containing protein [Nocardia sp.]MCU1641786.1 TetR family transcriptional regulator [Nocardia sp.]
MPRQTREELLAEIRAVALRMFASKGYGGTSLAEIAQEVGYSKGALLYHFGSKDQLLAEILDPISARIETLVGELTPIPRQQRWDRMLTELVEFAMRDRLEIACYGRLIDQLPEHPSVARWAATTAPLGALLIDDDAPLGDRIRVRFALVGLFNTPLRFVDAPDDVLREALSASLRVALADFAPV